MYSNQYPIEFYEKWEVIERHIFKCYCVIYDDSTLSNKTPTLDIKDILKEAINQAFALQISLKD